MTLTNVSPLSLTDAVRLTSSELAEFEAFVQVLAAAAGLAIRPHFRTLPRVQDKSLIGSTRGYDPVTEADKAAELAMRSLIEDRYPTHGIYGEEFDFKVGSSGLTWVLDPIDGTKSFVTGMLHWGTLIALFNGQKVVAGALYQPITDELFISNDEQSFLRKIEDAKLSSGTLLRTRSCDDLNQAVICCTDVAIFKQKGELTAFNNLLKATRMVRYGGDCYHYGLLAMGMTDLCVESALRAFDIQALIPVIEGAGGIVTNWRGANPALGGQIVAAGDAGVHQQALEILSTAAV